MNIVLKNEKKIETVGPHPVVIRILGNVSYDVNVQNNSDK